MAVLLAGKDVEALFPELRDITDPGLAEGVVHIWQEIAQEMLWESLEEIPKNTGPEKEQQLVKHIRGVTRVALATADIAQDIYGRTYDRNLLIAACLLHDVSKCVEYEPAGDRPAGATVRPGRKSRLGKNIQHGVYGAHKALAAGLPLELANLIITHTHRSAVRATTWEGALLFYADFADTDASLSLLGQPMFMQRWTIDFE